MPDEAAALAVKPPPAPSEEDYRAFNAALASSARGRAFLAEYARRNRNSDTEILLAGLSRLEARIAAEGAAVTRLRNELRMLLIAIRLTRPDIAAASGPAKAIKLAALLDQLERRIETMAEAERGDAQTPAPAFAGPSGPLAVVPTPDQPELPIPSPASGQPPAISIVKRTTSVPELTWFDGAPPKPSITKPPVAEQPAPAPVVAAAPVAAAPMPAPPPALVEQPVAVVTPPAPVAPPAPAAAQIPFAATALAAVVEAAMPTVKIIKAGAIPPPAHFTGEDFSPAPEPEPPPPASPAAEAAAPSVEVVTPIAEIAPSVEIVAPAAEIVAPPVEIAAAPVELATPPAEIGQPQPAAPAPLPPVDPLAVLMLLSEEERLALFT